MAHCDKNPSWRPENVSSNLGPAKSAKSGGLTWLGGAARHPSHRPKSAKSAKWLWALTAATSIVC
ncbi:hypothetical protein NQZ68_002448 [Dissostichus eleginoides]|nr:hypothetical protein NQZ68_002448 [Dissostichus eleginoides]